MEVVILICVILFTVSFVAVSVCFFVLLIQTQKLVGKVTGLTNTLSSPWIKFFSGLTELLNSLRKRKGGQEKK